MTRKKKDMGFSSSREVVDLAPPIDGMAFRGNREGNGDAAVSSCLEVFAPQEKKRPSAKVKKVWIASKRKEISAMLELSGPAGGYGGPPCRKKARAIRIRERGVSTLSERRPCLKKTSAASTGLHGGGEKHAVYRKPVRVRYDRRIVSTIS